MHSILITCLFAACLLTILSWINKSTVNTNTALTNLTITLLVSIIFNVLYTYYNNHRICYSVVIDGTFFIKEEITKEFLDKIQDELHFQKNVEITQCLCQPQIIYKHTIQIKNDNISN